MPMQAWINKDDTDFLKTLEELGFEVVKKRVRGNTMYILALHKDEKEKKGKKR